MPGMGHSDKWWSMYHSLVGQGHSESSAAAITTSQVGKFAACPKCGDSMNLVPEMGWKHAAMDGCGWATGVGPATKVWKRSGPIVPIAKIDPEQQLVFGWLSVAVDADGNPVEDLHEDEIPANELEGAAYEFVLIHRNAGEMHDQVEGIGRLIESFCTTPEKLQAMGIPDGILPQCGWWVGFKIDDPEVWAKIKSGEYGAFSIGGTAMREEEPDGDEAGGPSDNDGDEPSAAA